MAAKIEAKSSLRVQIGLLYALLAFINIIFFSVMIFSNQRDLLLLNFRYQADNLVKSVQEKLQKASIPEAENEAFLDFTEALKETDITAFTIFDDKGKIWHNLPEKEKRGSNVDAEMRRKSMELSADLTLYRSSYLKQIDEQNFTVSFLLPLQGEKGQVLFLSTTLSLQAIKDSLRSIYIQIAVAVVWGIVFHVLFAIFVFNLIFRRVEALTVASNDMASGNLHARAEWKTKRHDELDDLGTAFNSMAASIEEKVDTISKLNEEIQTELRIGKEVQKQFIRGTEELPRYKGAIYYRPMREVSGDIYGMFPFARDYAGFFFADASGHGVSAALITTITVQSLENALKKNMNPRRIVGSLNNSLAQRFESSYFATGTFMLFSPKGEVFITNAGHLPILCLRPSTGDLIEVTKMGPPMGLMEDFEYKVKRLNTRPGDRFLIYSDGLMETNNRAGEQFGIDRIINIFKENAQKPTEEFLDDLVTQFEAHAADYRDDVSAIALEVP
jgi:sigma-B regulation protein RsbU (phosphoserine phosphatase)